MSASKRPRAQPLRSPLRYTAYGSHIESELELWLGAQATGDWRADLRILSRVGVLDQGGESALGERSSRFFWPDLAEIRVEDGSQIDVCAVEHADPREVVAAVTGPALAAALGQRAHFALHGTCVALGASAVCLVGMSGAGKSTLAAALCAAGGALVSDTMTVVDVGSGNPIVNAGPAQLKLWPDAAVVHGYSPNALALALPDSDKRICPHSGVMALKPASLKNIFVLRPDETVATRELRPAAAVVALMENQFLAGYFDTSQRQYWLHQCARLSEMVRVFALGRGASLSDLPAVVDLLQH